MDENTEHRRETIRKYRTSILSEQEAKVQCLLDEGLDRSQISEELDMEEEQVRKHCSQIEVKILKAKRLLEQAGYGDITTKPLAVLCIEEDEKEVEHYIFDDGAVITKNGDSTSCSECSQSKSYLIETGCEHLEGDLPRMSDSVRVIHLNALSTEDSDKTV